MLETYNLAIKIKRLKRGGDYRYAATSPDLPNLLVVGDTAAEVSSLAPRVATALLASMKASGKMIPIKVRGRSRFRSLKRISVKV